MDICGVYETLGIFYTSLVSISPIHFHPKLHEAEAYTGRYIPTGGLNQVGIKQD